MNPKLILFVLCSALASTLVAGCATVRSWEREHLADPMMIFDADPLDQGVDEQHRTYREGSTGGTIARAGGCGCG